MIWYTIVYASLEAGVKPRVRPNFGVNVPGTGEEMVRRRTNFSPVPGTEYDSPLSWDAPSNLKRVTYIQE